MRYLILQRERALAAFALTYYCHLNRDRQAHMEQLQAMADPRLEATGDYGIKNGQTIRIPISEEENRFFMGIYTQTKNHVSGQVPVPAGTEDVTYRIITDYDGDKRLSFRIEPVSGTEN